MPLNIPHVELAHAESTAGAMFPAARVRALWTADNPKSNVCVEISHGRVAKVVPWLNGSPAC